MTSSGLKNKKRVVYLLSFFIPAIIMLISFIVNKVYPFGGNSLLISDCAGQYVDYLSYLKTIFTSNNDFLYTFSKNLGGDMAGLSAYYLLSPLNFILFFFSNSGLPEALFLIILIKIGLCGLTFAYFIYNSNKTKRISFSGLIFSSSYALMGYNMIYFWDVMWLDGVILLPLVILGVNRILEDKKCLLYISCLSLALITNYYIGFMICIFSVIYFTYKVLLLIDNLQDIKIYVKNINQYILSSLLSGGISAFVIIPTIFSLRGGKASFSASVLKFSENYKFIDVFSKLYSNTVDAGQITEGLPNIFCGMFIVVMAALYFFNTNIKIKEKFLSVGILFSILISFHINTFNLIWHGFNPPAWFPYRYSFVFSFLLIYIGYLGFINLKNGITKKNIFYCGTFILISSMIILRSDFSFIRINHVYLDIAIVLCLCYIFYLFIEKKGNAGILIILAAFLQFSNLLFNSAFSVRNLRKFSSLDSDSYKNYVNLVSPVIDKVKSIDSGLYRLEKTFQRSHNDSMQFAYNGLSHYSSCEKSFVKQFQEKMGFRNNNNWAYYNKGSTVSVDSLLGVKYLLSQNEVYKPYDNIFEEGGITVFKNPYFMPLCISSSSGVCDVDISAQKDPFSIQNLIWKGMTENKYGDIFTPAVSVSENMENLKQKKEEDLKIYKKSDNLYDSFINYNIKIDNNNLLYFYIEAPENQDIEIFLNNNYLCNYLNTYSWGVVCLGKFNIGDEIELKIKVNGDCLKINNVLLYYEDIEVLKNSRDYLTTDLCEIEKLSSSHLKGTVDINSDNKYIILSIPYEEDWNVLVDGENAEAHMILDALMAIPISKGKHSIELKYIPKGLYLGISVSCISIILLILTTVYLRRKNLKK